VCQGQQLRFLQGTCTQVAWLIVRTYGPSLVVLLLWGLTCVQAMREALKYLGKSKSEDRDIRVSQVLAHAFV
jgi:hypothetical protein